MAVYDYRIAANWGVALGSLTNIEDITPSTDRAFAPPEGFGNFSSGLQVIRTDGTIYLAGYASTVWNFEVLTRKQYEYLSTTYCGGSVSGKVTIYTRTAHSTYTRYNAIIVLPPKDSLEGSRRYEAWLNVPVAMRYLVAL
jgi:hypothetical protein